MATAAAAGEDLLVDGEYEILPVIERSESPVPLSGSPFVGTHRL